MVADDMVAEDMVADDDLLAAARRDPTDVARLVRAGIEEGDPRAADAVIALALAGMAPPDAASQLRAALGRASGVFLVRAAAALHVLTGDRSPAQLIAGVLVVSSPAGPPSADPPSAGSSPAGSSGAGSDEAARLAAVTALAAFPPTGMLIAAVSLAERADPAESVRRQATDTLRRWGELHPA